MHASLLIKSMVAVSFWASDRSAEVVVYRFWLPARCFITEKTIILLDYE